MIGGGHLRVRFTVRPRVRFGGRLGVLSVFAAQRAFACSWAVFFARARLREVYVGS
jgi:hypothetical protein